MHVGVLVVDGVADFGLAAVLEVLGTAEALRTGIPGALPPWTVTTLGIDTETRSGAGHLIPTTPVTTLTHRPDVLVVPAVNVKDAETVVEMVTAPQTRAVMTLIQETAQQGARLGAACSGTFFLAESGILDGKPATTSWWLAPAFRARYPRVTLEEGHLLRSVGPVTTAGAAFAHVDLALSLVRGRSPALADLVARYLLIGSRPPQAAFAVPAVVAAQDPLTADFERWIRQNLARPFTVVAACRALGVSERSLQRATAATLGMTPGDLVAEIRLDQAVHLLRTTSLTTSAVAAAVGYSNVGTLRDLARKRRRMTLRELKFGVPPGTDLS